MQNDLVSQMRSYAEEYNIPIFTSNYALAYNEK